jgi:hypothetical protein
MKTVLVLIIVCSLCFVAGYGLMSFVEWAFYPAPAPLNNAQVQITNRETTAIIKMDDGRLYVAAIVGGKK